MNGKGSEQRILRSSEDGIFQRSLFNLFSNKSQKKKKSFVEEKKHQYLSRSTVCCKGSDHEGSRDESRKENGRPQISNSKVEPCMVAHVPSVADSALCYWKVKQFLEKWGKHCNDKVLDLNNCALNATDIMELIAILPLLPHLEEINLAWNDLIGGALEPLALQFKHIQELKVLRLNNCRLSAMDVAFLGCNPNQLSSTRAREVPLQGKAVEVIPCLEILDLSWNNIGGNLSLLTSQIPKGYKLRTLKLTDCNLVHEDGEFLGSCPSLPLIYLRLSSRPLLLCYIAPVATASEFLGRCSKLVLSLGEIGSTEGWFPQKNAQLLNRLHSLEILDLSINKSIGSSLKSIAQELKYVSSLKVLSLHMCGLKQDGFQSLDTALQYLLELKTLNVSCNKEIGGGFKNSEAHLASLSSLEVLDLHQCCITEEDMTVLTQIIPLLSSLQELNLSSNKSIGMSSEHLLSRLRFLPRLKSLHLSGCLLKLDSFASLAEAASHLPELKILDLSWNKCVGGNLKLILKALNLGAEIQVLRLSSCSLEDEDLACFALVMQAGRLPKLQKLDLSYNNHVSDQGWAKFYQGLAALEQLSELDVSLRLSSPCDCGEWFGTLLAALPKLLMFRELSLQGWLLSEAQQKELESFKRDNEQNICIDLGHGT